MSRRTRRIEWSPAYDNMAKGQGCHGVDMRWYLQGKEGAVQFVVFTNWMLPSTYETWKYRGFSPEGKPSGADVGYHSLKPRYPEQTPGACNVLPKGKCYYDGSSLLAENFLQILISEGGEAVWSKLEEMYDKWLVQAPEVVSGA